LGLGADNLVVPDNDQPRLGNWFVHMFTVDRKKTLIFMNERTLLPLFFSASGKLTVRNYLTLFLVGLEQFLTINEFPPDQIEGVLDRYSEFGFTKTDSRTSLGNLNDLVFHYRYSILDDGGFASCDIGGTIFSINRMPQRRLHWKNSIEITRQILDANST
jgi:hypothetical protein